MKKINLKILSLLLCAVMVLGTVAVGGDGFVEVLEAISVKASATKSGIYTYTVTNGEAIITDCDSSVSGDITIPSTLGGYPVTSIGDCAFEYCTGLKSITIPNSVTSIGDHAFEWCDRLTSVTIPNSVTSIGDSSFDNCRSLTSITIPNSVTSIGEFAFGFCDSLTSIIVDSTNKYYSNDKYGVLFNKDKTELIQYPVGNSRISYSIPEGVTSIGDEAFAECVSLTSISIPSSVTSIGDAIFAYCIALTSVKIGNGVTNIGDEMFAGCESLASITIPNSVKSISCFAFEECTALTSVTIPNGVTSIGDEAFANCVSLTSISIPSSVTSIGQGIFADCIALTSVKIGKGVTNIGDGMFVGCENLTSVTIPNSVTFIGAEAFYYCAGLTSITIPNSVKIIGAEAFSCCWSLTSIIIPDSVTNISDRAFHDCVSLTNIIVDSNNACYSSDKYGVLFNKDKTELIQYPVGNSRISYNVPGSVKIIGNEAFSFCYYIKRVTIGNGIMCIGDFAFWCCENLTYIHIPSSVTTIGSRILQESNAYICSDSSNCYAKTYAEENGYEFKLCSGHSEELYIVSFQPGNEADDVKPEDDLVITFNKTVDTELDFIAYGSEISVCDYATDKKVYVLNDNRFLPNQIFDNNKITIPGALKELDYGKKYYVLISPGVITADDYKTKFSGITSKNEYTFTLTYDKITVSQKHFKGHETVYSAYALKEKYHISNLVMMDGFLSDADCCIPGVYDGYIPQGLAYYEDKNWLLISSYDANQERPSIITALDFDTGELVAQFNLYYSKKTMCKQHVGGIAVSDYNLYITKDNGVARVPLSELDIPRGYAKNLYLPNDNQFEVKELGDTNAAYVNFSEGILWMGNFYSTFGKLIGEEGWSTKAPNSSSVILGFKLSGTNSEDEWNNFKEMSRSSYNISVPLLLQSIQGVTVNDGVIYLSRTVDASCSSVVSVGKLDLSSKDISLQKVLFTDFTNLSGAENIIIKDNYLYSVYESKALQEAGKNAWHELTEVIKDYSDSVGRMNIPGKSLYQKYRAHLIRCPVDVEVLDRNSGEVVAKIVNNEVDRDVYDGDNALVVQVIGDTKIIYIPDQDNYEVRITGNGTGEMNYTVVSLDDNQSESVRQNYFDISITPETSIVGGFDSQDSTTDVNNFYLTQNKTVINPDEIVKDASKTVHIETTSENGGTITSSFDVVRGDSVEVIASPDDTYCFSGWYNGSTLVCSDSEYMFVAKENVTLTAKFKIIIPTDKPEIKVTTLPKKLVYHIYDDLETEGLVLSVTHSDGTVDLVTEGFSAEAEMITGGKKDVTVTYHNLKTTYPIEVLAPHNVTFMVNGEVYDESVYFKGDRIIIPDDPEIENNHFVGWAEDIPYYMGDSDLVFNAIINPIEYEAFFYSQNKLVGYTKYLAGDTELKNIPEVPSVPYGLNGKWEDYDLSKGGNIKINAIYESPTQLSASKRTLKIGESYKLLTFANFEGESKVWFSNDTSVATVDSHGNVTAISEGKCTVTVISTGVDEIGNPISSESIITIVVEKNPENQTAKDKFENIFISFIRGILDGLTAIIKYLVPFIPVE